MTPKKSSDDDLIEVEVEGDESAPQVAITPAVQESEPEEPEARKRPDEDIEALRRQLNDLQQAQDGYRLREREAQLAAQRAAQEMQSFRHSAEQSQYDTIITAMGAAEIEVEAAKRDIALCGQAQDYEGLAHAQERLTAAKTRMVNLEQYKDAYERAAQQQARPVTPPAPVGDPIAAMIDQNPNLSFDERLWLKEHPEALSDMKKNAKLNAAYFEALDKGLKRGSRDYFHFIEEKLGYREPETVVEKPDEDEPVIVAAPPSKSSPSGTGTGGPKGKFHMTAEEAEVAKASGISPQEYVLQREKLKELKKAGHYQQG